MKGCRAARVRIEKAVDDRLALEERFLLEEHLTRCPRCAQRHEHALAVDEALERMVEPPLDRLDVDAAVASIRHAIDTDPGTEVRLGDPSRRRRARLAAAATLVIATGVVMVWAFTRGGGESPAAPEEVAIPEIPTADAPSKEQVAVAPTDETAPPTEAVTDDEFDLLRLQEARDRVRTQLARAFTGFVESDDPRAFADRFDLATHELRREGWPVGRILEGLLADEDSEIARRAARYLGVRGDRTTVSLLAASLEDPPLKRAALRALGDLGRPAVEAVASVLRDPVLADRALVQLAGIGGRRAAEAIEAELTNPDGTTFERDRLYWNLVATGPESLESFLRLARHDSGDAIDPLERLRSVRGAGAELVRLLESGSHRYPAALLHAAVEELEPAGALPWLEEACDDYRRRPTALACLGRWSGPDPIDVLLRLEARGAVPDAELVATMSELLARDSGRVTASVENHIEAATQWANALDDLERLLDLLLATGHRGASASLVALAFADPLPVDARQWAALAAGELGDERDAERLRARLSEIDPDDRRLLAACLIAIHEHLGPSEASVALEELSLRSPRRVLAALDDLSPNTTRAVGLHRVARALDGASTSRNPKLRRSSL